MNTQTSGQHGVDAEAQYSAQQSDEMLFLPEPMRPVVNQIGRLKDKEKSLKQLRKMLKKSPARKGKKRSRSRSRKSDRDSAERSACNSANSAPSQQDNDRSKPSKILARHF